MDAILKGNIPEKGKVLDVGCGEGRNGVFFIRNGYTYKGVDMDSSKIHLLEYLSLNLSNSAVSFESTSIDDLSALGDYDLVIASRVLHFAENAQHFLKMWNNIKACLRPSGIIYFSMDSAIAKDYAMHRGDGLFEFQDGRVSFALTTSLYEKMNAGMREVESLQTIIYHNKRVQSFGLLQSS